jgi:hypothetical protein
MNTTRRTPLVASGLIAGALIGALPPVQMLAENWQCASSGGRYDVALRACAYRAAPRVTPQTTWPVKLQHEREW